MCGLFGVASVRPGATDWARVVRAGLARIRHRGPDALGVYASETTSGAPAVTLGHVRLSIIDIEGGHQPMRDDEADLTVAYNGEIYNFRELRDELEGLGHRFTVRSDTQVLLKAYRQWGDECVQHLRGMFAFALWDGRQRRLLLARDRFGQKPLFIAQLGGTLIFGSEIKAFRKVPDLSPELDHDALAAYLRYRYVPGPATLLRGVSKLPPGSLAVWQDGQLHQSTYYRPPDRSPCAGRRIAEPVASFGAALQEAVRVRMISDVPYGAFLSGGIDSSAIVGLMSACSDVPVKTFSVGFDEADYSELDHARTVARHFSTEHHEMRVSHDALIEHLPALVRFRDAPVSEPSDIPIYLLSVEARTQVKMVLTGEGSDEMLGGYPKHVFERYASAYQRVPRVLRRRVLEPLVHALPYRFRRAKTAIDNLGLEAPEDRLPGWFGALTPAALARLATQSLMRTASVAVPFDVEPGNSALRRILYFDQTSWLPDNLLERGDRMTMAASLEARMPFMDHELAALASSLPDELRIRGRTTKWILREAVRSLLPAAILDRPKVGFRLPVNEWFRGSMRDYLRDHLTGAASLTRGFFDADQLQRVLQEHERGRHNHEKLLWMLLNLEIWCREYRDWVRM